MTPELFHRAQEIFLRATEVEITKRRTWVAEQCGNNEELKALVHSLVQHDDTKTLFASDPTKPAEAKSRQTTVPASMRMLHKLPPRGLMALGALAVLLPVFISGWIANRALNDFKNRLRAASLVDLVDSKAAAIRFWLDREKSVVQSWADSTKVRQLVAELAAISASSDVQAKVDALINAPQQSQLNRELEVLAGHQLRYAVWDRSLTTIADWSPTRSGVGVGVTPAGAERLTTVMEEGPTTMVIGPNDRITRQYSDMPSQPIFAILVPVTDEERNVIATMMVADSEGTIDLGDFLGFSLASTSEDPSGGTFIFDSSGMLLYDSPYDEQLRKLGLIPEGENSFSAKQLTLRDPGVDLTRGGKPAESFASRPLTKMVRMAINEGSGVDIEGYRDVRGVMVVGAWHWLADHRIGVGIEVEKDALEPIYWVAKLQSWAMMGLLGMSLAVAGYSFLTIQRLKDRIQSNQQLGPYVLEKMVGEGGMGRVFKARHNLLKRPTAIKLLRPELTNQSNIARFQREAQLAARLEHPNTVSVFDFGLADSNQFYLVMEWIDGVTLDRLVQQEGPINTDRALRILRQIACSLREAHVLGLIHRDLKPQNVMLTQRASESDVVKVLDFGLARDLRAGMAGNESMQNLTDSGLIAGTPRYMAPERWNSMIPAGPAIDVFAFGCIGYFVLTGKHLIKGKSVEEIYASSMEDLPGSPATVLHDAVPKWLDELITRCTEKSPELRPATFDAVIEAMDAGEGRC